MMKINILSSKSIQEFKGLGITVSYYATAHKVMLIKNVLKHNLNRIRVFSLKMPILNKVRVLSQWYIFCLKIYLRKRFALIRIKSLFSKSKAFIV